MLPIKAPWTERLLPTFLSELLTLKFTPEWCFKFCLHHSIAFPIQSSKFFHKILQSRKVHTVRFITETKPLLVPICVLVSFSITARGAGKKKENKSILVEDNSGEVCLLGLYFQVTIYLWLKLKPWNMEGCWLLECSLGLLTESFWADILIYSRTNCLRNGATDNGRKHPI